jgi:trehalose 6-phosphate phosphatase
MVQPTLRMTRTRSEHLPAAAAGGLPVRQDGNDFALFLDVDGTLLEIAGSPDAVRVDPRLLDLLPRLRQQLGGAMALVSGRRIEDLGRLFGLAGLPMAGIHGLERRRGDGQIVRGVPDCLPAAVRQPLYQLAAMHPGVLIEDKGAAVAVHYRAAPEAEADARAAVAEALAQSTGRLTLLDGKMVLEVRWRGSTKGDAIAAFMNEAPFSGRRVLFAGDDVTDEDGFEVVNRLGGWSIRVGDDRSTAAHFRLSGVSAVIGWLELLAGSKEEGESRS